MNVLLTAIASAMFQLSNLALQVPGDPGSSLKPIHLLLILVAIILVIIFRPRRR